jgi:hypothetical protein
VLLENAVLPCDVNAELSCTHSFVAGVFSLEEGDAVALRVTDARMLGSQDMVQLGIHRI